MTETKTRALAHGEVVTVDGVEAIVRGMVAVPELRAYALEVRVGRVIKRMRYVLATHTQGPEVGITELHMHEGTFAYAEDVLTDARTRALLVNAR